jgi:predicted Ser/Thr protein kinase
MHHPLKHIIVGRKPVLIDFERCHDTDKPKNVTQFLMFLGGTKVKALLRRKGFRLTRQQLIDTARSYKKSYDFSVVERLLGEHA